MRVAESLRAAIAGAEIRCDALSVRLTLSIGVYAIHPGEWIDPDEAIRRADAALYLAKNDGRDRVRAPISIDA